MQDRTQPQDTNNTDDRDATAQISQAEQLQASLYTVKVSRAVELLKKRGYYARRVIVKTKEEKIRVIELHKQQSEFGLISWSETTIMGPDEVFEFLDTRS